MCVDNTKKKVHLCVIAEGYPYENDAEYTFVAQLVEAFAEMGVRCSVIAPQSISKRFVRKIIRRPVKWSYTTQKGKKIEIHQPKVFSVSKLRLGGFSISYWLKSNAMKSTLGSMKEIPDICYGHFWHSAYAVFREAKKLNIPLFVATGESVISLPKKARLYDKREFSEYLSGVVCVSTKNKLESIELGLAHEEQCIVLPNGIDSNKFYPKERRECRRMLGISDEVFVVVFVGAFIPRKGANRVSAAISQLDDENIKSFFIGSAPAGGAAFSPSCKGIEFCGRLNHDELNEYLNAADVFVLPTLHEGCCNAIVEAMACGLPIISSNLPFNDEILNDSNSIRIDPLDIDGISEAIALLKVDRDRRGRMSRESLTKVAELDIQDRGEKILSFMMERANH